MLGVGWLVAFELRVEWGNSSQLQSESMGGVVEVVSAVGSEGHSGAFGLESIGSYDEAVVG